MFIAIKDTKLIAIHEVEWECRRWAKGLGKTDYWTWIASVTDSEGVVDFSGEDYDVKEVEQDLTEFNKSGHIISYKTHFLKWDASKKEIVKDDTAKAAYDLAEEWKRIRTERTRLLAETDWVVIKARENGGQVSTAWKTYRVALRDLPADQSDKTKYSEITWPTQPS